MIYLLLALSGVDGLLLAPETVTHRVTIKE